MAQYVVIEAGPQPPAQCLDQLEGASSPLLDPPYLLSSHQAFDLVTCHLLLLFQMLQLLLDPYLVLFVQSLPPCLGQEELQGHIWDLPGLGGISLGSARSPCVSTALGLRVQLFNRTPLPGLLLELQPGPNGL